MFRFLSGWVALVVMAILAALAELFDHIPWVNRIGWTLAALVGVHAAIASWRE